MKIRDMAFCGLFSALLAVCSWLYIPMADTALTLQSFGVLLTLGLLGGKKGTAAIAVYLVPGAVGMPIFGGFRGGLGVLVTPGGGYLLGFLLSGLVYWLTEKKGLLLPMILAQLACYLMGTVWYFALFTAGGTPALGGVLLKSVIPFLLPDGLKLALAYFLTKKLRRFV